MRSFETKDIPNLTDELQNALKNVRHIAEDSITNILTKVGSLQLLNKQANWNKVSTPWNAAHQDAID
jgi:hypothetical protein